MTWNSENLDVSIAAAGHAGVLVVTTGTTGTGCFWGMLLNILTAAPETFKNLIQTQKLSLHSGTF